MKNYNIPGPFDFDIKEHDIVLGELCFKDNEDGNTILEEIPIKIYKPGTPGKLPIGVSCNDVSKGEKSILIVNPLSL